MTNFTLDGRLAPTKWSLNLLVLNKRLSHKKQATKLDIYLAALRLGEYPLLATPGLPQKRTFEKVYLDGWKRWAKLPPTAGQFACCPALNETPGHHMTFDSDLFDLIETFPSVVLVLNSTWYLHCTCNYTNWRVCAYSIECHKMWMFTHLCCFRSLSTGWAFLLIPKVNTSSALW